MHRLCAMLLTLTALSGCVSSQTGTAVTDRALPLLADCAAALAGDSIEVARAECIPALSTIEAGAGK